MCLPELINDIKQSLSGDETMEQFNLHTLLYADDTVLMAETPGQLQSALDTMSLYCDNNKLSVNAEKQR